MYSNQEEDAHVTSSPMGSTAETAFAPFEPAGVRSDAGPSLSFDGTRYREDKPTGFTADLVVSKMPRVNFNKVISTEL
jgi:hypothetical protein